METASNKSSNATDWLLTLVSFIAFVLFLKYADEWFWLSLPFLLTYLVRALKSM